MKIKASFLSFIFLFFSGNLYAYCEQIDHQLRTGDRLGAAKLWLKKDGSMLESISRPRPDEINWYKNESNAKDFNRRMEAYNSTIGLKIKAINALERRIEKLERIITNFSKNETYTRDEMHSWAALAYYIISLNNNGDLAGLYARKKMKIGNVVESSDERYLQNLFLSGCLVTAESILLNMVINKI